MNQNSICQTFADNSPQFSIRQFVFLSLNRQFVFLSLHRQFVFMSLIRQFVFLSLNRQFVFLSLTATHNIARGAARLCERNPKVADCPRKTRDKRKKDFLLSCISRVSRAIFYLGIARRASLHPTLYYLSPSATRNN